MSVNLIKNSSLHHRVSMLGGCLKVLNMDGWMALRIEFCHKFKNGASIVEVVHISLKDKQGTLHIVSQPLVRSVVVNKKYLFKETYGKDKDLMDSISKYLLFINLQ